MKNKIAVNWEKLSNDQLLQVRIMDLDLQISGSALETATQRLHQELEARGIRFRPPCYLADEWLCPDREPIIGIPFCLAHPRLKSIEIEMMYEAGQHPTTTQ